MSENKFSWPLFDKVPVIGIVRNVSLEDIIEILPAYVQASLTTIEITMNTPDAEEIIKYAIQHYPENLNVGAGTVCTKEDLNKALDSGAQFIVTPIVKRKVIAACVQKQIPVFPGAFSPTEIYKAWTLGASMVKVFPARTLGADFIKDVKAPLSQIKLMPTGGIDIDNIENFKKAGADAFGIGSPLFKKILIKEKDWDGLKEHFKHFVEKVTIKA